MSLAKRGMVRRTRNWTYRDVTDFLRENGFSFYKEVKGSHQAWIKRAARPEEDKIVGLHFTRGSYPPKTIRRLAMQSGIDLAEWIKWGGS